MPRMKYQSETKYLPPGEPHYRDITLMVDPGNGGGRIEIQVMDASGDTEAAWYTPEDGATYQVKGAFAVRRANTPPMRIISFNGAKFEVIGK
ncbi:hypothetical protein LX81_02174 [Palleronia aestuarii]|uniref:Uncharacterized protein n=1 Tax=Palleronia aestuarii TaxID=568105 RepID=A0A2W7NYQ1_9RHOB|nr:hypothetical protein [Palleronia aestuarii]PZX16322.1 hypothetical protein LX81_02174 [Palleronia aestuarii]